MDKQTHESRSDRPVTSGSRVGTGTGADAALDKQGQVSGQAPANPTALERSVGAQAWTEIDDLKERFNYDAFLKNATGDIREKCLHFIEYGRVTAEYLVKNVPNSRWRAMALTELENGVLWGIRGILARVT